MVEDITKSPFTIFRNEILKLHPACSDAEWDYLRSGLEVQQLKTKAFFIEAGKAHNHLGFIVSGLVRAFYIDSRGEEITVLFIKENEYATDYPSFLMQTPGRYHFQCLEPSTIITLPYSHMQQGYQLFPGFERYGRLVAEEVLKTLQKRIESFQFDRAEQRYLNFTQQNPELFQRISLTHLASYLGIERPSLSRIRKNIARL
jgi:CRP-like cAMP-binding protein